MPGRHLGRAGREKFFPVFFRGRPRSPVPPDGLLVEPVEPAAARAEMVLRSLGGGGLLSRSFALASRRGAALTPALGGARRQMGVVVGSPPPDEVDALIIGGGVMGASVAVMLKLLHPTWNIRLIEQLDRVGAHEGFWRRVRFVSHTLPPMAQAESRRMSGETRAPATRRSVSQTTLR